MDKCFKIRGLNMTVNRPLLMGILNLTPDSFSDGGKYHAPENALRKVKNLIEAGADIIDLGAESTRPGSQPVSVEEELDRLLPVLRELPKDKFFVSVDSCKMEVQTTAIQNGAHIINDILGGTNELFECAEQHSCGVVCMHTPAPPLNMQQHTDYDDVVEAVLKFFESQHAILQRFDLPRYWVDPGIGFGKTPEQSIELMRNTKRFCGKDWGVLVGASRKSWIGNILNAEVEQRLGGSIAAALQCASQGAEILRVHDVQETKQALDVARLLTI